MGPIDFYHKLQARLILQSLFDHFNNVRNFSNKVRASELAWRIISVAWDNNKILYDGTHGIRPHKLVLAASALRYALELYPAHSTERLAITIALTNALNEIEANGFLYGFSDLDKTLVINIMLSLQDYINELDEQ